MADQLDLEQWASSQDQPDLTVNTSLVQLSSVISDYKTYDMTSANITLSLADFQDYGLFVTTNNGATFNTFTLPEQRRAFFMVFNDGSDPLLVECGTTTITVPINEYYGLTMDGTANGLSQVSLVATAGSLAGLTDVTISTPLNSQILTYNTGASKWENENAPYDIAFCFSGMPGTSQTVEVVAVRSYQFPIGLTGSKFNIGVDPASTMTFSLEKNGSPIGSVAFSTGGSPTVTFASAVTFAAGDVLGIVAPNPQDATGANVGFSFVAILQ